ncbi:hypothetical protein BDK51DRAFT_37062 [Blyttiomyces helicus]|uniref:Uncharacterized protein n=1 Tax=Blyttiomyces helicus TaxID=388810 RepID=A0A4P9W6E6_9FUNG|nr:hypothetical protein BDK51DRAFT_37062 [Blyttiomyces helicus]|eukprot:RKO87884.1 hypothetical protein BDK51DRAFT_37062 [Blyttiomyces helicus]
MNTFLRSMLGGKSTLFLVCLAHLTLNLVTLVFAFAFDPIDAFLSFESWVARGSSHAGWPCTDAEAADQAEAVNSVIASPGGRGGGEEKKPTETSIASGASGDEALYPVEDELSHRTSPLVSQFCVEIFQLPRYTLDDRTTLYVEKILGTFANAADRGSCIRKWRSLLWTKLASTSAFMGSDDDPTLGCYPIFGSNPIRAFLRPPGGSSATNLCPPVTRERLTTSPLCTQGFVDVSDDVEGVEGGGRHDVVAIDARYLVPVN